MQNTWLKAKCDFCGKKVDGNFSCYTKGDIKRMVRMCRECNKEMGSDILIRKWEETYEERMKGGEI